MKKNKTQEGVDSEELSKFKVGYAKTSTYMMSKLKYSLYLSVHTSFQIPIHKFYSAKI